jgi:hypothetical protein
VAWRVRNNIVYDLFNGVAEKSDLEERGVVVEIDSHILDPRHHGGSAKKKLPASRLRYLHAPDSNSGLLHLSLLQPAVLTGHDGVAVAQAGTYPQSKGVHAAPGVTGNFEEEGPCFKP